MKLDVMGFSLVQVPDGFQLGYVCIIYVCV